MKFNPEELLGEISELMAEADAEAAKGGRLHKAGNSAHTSTKSGHHERMAELCAKMADNHSSIADHYKTGAKGSSKTRKADEDAGGEVEEVEQEAGKDEAKKSSGYGALDAVRNRPSRAREGVTRAELNDTLNEFGENFASALIKIFTPPTEPEPTGDELAAVRLLEAQGYVVRSQSGGVKKGAALDTAAAPDRSKVGTQATEAAGDALDEKIRKLKAVISSADATALSNPASAAVAAEARVELDTLAKAAVKAALRAPHVAASGEIAGYRGVTAANL